MIEAQIEVLKNRLNHLIDQGMDTSEVYELSVELDKLIVQFYSKTLKSGES